jgi:hypothetical protein
MTRQIANDGADRWVNNVLFRRLNAHPEPPRARYVKRKPVSIAALHIVKPEHLRRLPA